VPELVRYEVTRSLVTMLRGSTPRPADRRGRARRSSRRHRMDDSSSSSTTDVSRSGDESAVAALLGAVRATPTPSTVREGTRGIDPRTLPTPDSMGGEQGGGAERELPRGIDPGFPMQLSLATGTETEGWPTQATPTPSVKSVWSSGCVTLLWQRSWAVSSHLMYPRRPHDGSSGSPLSEHTHVPQFSVRAGRGAPPRTGHAPPHTSHPSSSPKQSVPTTRPTNQVHTSTKHTTSA